MVSVRVVDPGTVGSEDKSRFELAVILRVTVRAAGADWLSSTAQLSSRW